MSIEILYEDNHIIVVVKSVGILSQEDSTHDPDMLTLLKNYIKNKYQKLGNVYLGLIHRLDRMTGGIMVFAKTSKSAARLNKQIQDKEFFKKYYAIVDGNIEEDGTLENYLVKDEKEVKSYIGNVHNGKLAVLDYHIVKKCEGMTLVDINLKTGRHHQIRVQFANIHHPLIGDHLYGCKRGDKMMLYAYKISFLHPITKERLEFVKKPTGELWNKFLNNEEI